MTKYNKDKAGKLFGGFMGMNDEEYFLFFDVEPVVNPGREGERGFFPRVVVDNSGKALG